MPTFSRVIVFGDSLSDVGNVREKVQDKFFISYPGGDFNYSDGRFTNSSDTDPRSVDFQGVWHEQLASRFLGLPAATASLRGGLNYAFGGATTEEGSQDVTVFNNPTPFQGGTNTVTIDNIGRQLDRYLNEQTVDPQALYIIWGGGNDLFKDQSANTILGSAQRVVANVNRLINAGARNFLIPNVPPLGSIPFYDGDAAEQEELNVASREFRRELNNQLNINVIAGPGPTAPVVYRLDIWSLFVRFAADPTTFGFTNILDPAQGRSSANPDQYLFWDDIHPTTAAHFQIAQEANRVLSGASQPTALALNLSTRANVQTGDNVAIGGFIITGTEPKRVVLRGIGPSLTSRGVAGALIDPRIELFDAARTSLAVNDNWMDTQAAEILASGLAPMNNLESAMIQTLAPGDYTVVLSGVGNTSGIGLVEIYDANSAAKSTLANLSTRGAVGQGDNILIGGVIVGQGDDAITVVRALGPSLTTAGVANALQDPTLEIFDGNGMQIGANDDWQSNQSVALRASSLAPGNDLESAFVAALAPGQYTAVVRGKNGSTGVALVEVFRVP